MPDFSNPDVWMDHITTMRKLNLLKEETADDGQPLPSDDLVANFIRELDEERNFEVMSRLLKGQRVAPQFRIKTLTAMFHAVNMIAGLQYGALVVDAEGLKTTASAAAKETLSGYLFILSTLKPFDQVLFTKKWDISL